MKPGLYYPYIRIRDVRWLQATLLMLPRLYRLVPETFSPWDDEPTQAFATTWRDDGKALLEPANLEAGRVQQAIEALQNRLEQDSQDRRFVARFNKEITRKNLTGDDLGVQLHRLKLSEKLVHLLISKKLAWEPVRKEPTDPDGSLYIEVNERLGEAIMSTIAIAAADFHGADIVAEPRSEQLHACLVEKQLAEVYDAWLHPTGYPEQPRRRTGELIFEFFVDWACDIHKLTPARIMELQGEQKAVASLLAELNRLGGHLQIGDPAELEKELKGLIRQVLDEWEGSRTQGKRFMTEFLGKGVGAPGVEFLKKLLEKGLAPGTSGTAAGLLTGKVLGGLTVGGLIGAAAGLAIGVTVHGVASFIEADKMGKTSPRRYLSMLTEAGVAIRVPSKFVDDKIESFDSLRAYDA